MKIAKKLVGKSRILFVLAVLQVAICKEITGNLSYIYEKPSATHRQIEHSASPIYHTSNIIRR